MKVETFKTMLRDIEQLYSWPYIFIHPKQSPADCDHKYIRGIHLLDVITDTAMEGEAHSQLWVVPLESEKKNKQYKMLIRKRCVKWKSKEFEKIKKKKNKRWFTFAA